MTEHAAKLRCPSCGAQVDSAVAGGLCPACLLKQAALGTGMDSGPSSAWMPPTVEELAAVFPQLEIVGLIGHGGMGAVYKARQKSLGRLVALKVLAPHHATNPDFAERFAREAKVLAEVNHPNIVTVYDFGQAGDFYYLTMEFVDGVNLRQAMSAGRLTPKQALAVVPPICEALQFAHERGIVHRDIKPENLLLDKDGRIKIADFGIARMMRCEPARKSGTSAVGFAPGELTQQSVLGTPQYMAPEQREAPSAVDHRADIYSLGVVLYEMLTGELPGAKLAPPSKKVQIDVRLDEIVLRALEQQPELRFQTAAELRTQVDAFVTSQSTASESMAPRVLISGSGIVTTPERLATWHGQLAVHRDRGEMILDERQLTIRKSRGLFHAAEETLIPLSAIRDVGVERYPAMVNLIGLDNVRLTYETKGQTRQVCFTPSPGPWCSLASVNQHVAEWCDAIRAVTQRREPQSVSRAPPMTPAFEFRIHPWFLVFASTLLGFALSLKNAPGTLTEGHAILMVLVYTGLGFAWGCVLAWIFGRLRKLTNPRSQEIP